MAVVDIGTIASQARGFNGLTILRQFGLLIGIAVSVAIGVTVVDWSQEPDYRMLYNNLDPKDASQIATALQGSGVPYKVSEATGGIMVGSADIYEARIFLASQGLPNGVGTGYEMLDEGSMFGVSHFMENIRYQRALEGELSRTIMSINSVRNARVHLAIPKKTAFIRKQKKPSASVTVDLFPGRTLIDEQVSAISHMVAASIPELDFNDVTVIDFKGRLLRTPGSSSNMQLTSTHFEYRKKVEAYYSERIENLLTPILGAGAIRAEVSADIDFTVTEQTRESFNPDLPAIRSEQLVEESSKGKSSGGIPGSVSNQNPDNALAANASSGGPSNNTKRTIRNYELDRTISHVKAGADQIKRLSIAVVVDNDVTINEDGTEARTPVTEEKILKIIRLVKDAVGFDAARGDTLNVINETFSIPPAPEPLPEPSLLEQPGMIELAKQVGAGIVILLLIFGVLKPVLKDLATKGEAVATATSGASAGAAGMPMSADQVSISQPSADIINKHAEESLTNAKKLANDDPKLAAQVVNNWVSADG